MLVESQGTRRVDLASKCKTPSTSHISNLRKFSCTKKNHYDNAKKQVHKFEHYTNSTSTKADKKKLRSEKANDKCSAVSNVKCNMSERSQQLFTRYGVGIRDR